MAYTHQQVEVTAAAAVSLADATVARWGIGYVPQKLRAVAMVITTTVATAARVCTVVYRPTPGSATGQTALGVINIPVAAVVGKSYYIDTDLVDHECAPGGEIAVVISGGTATGNAHVNYLLEPSWEHPSNSSNMIETA